MTGSDDAALLAGAARGDRAAFGAFVERHQGRVWRYLKSAGAGDADAEDALQETFLAAWRGCDGYRGGASARGWILTIARNALRRMHRTRAGEPADLESLDDLGRDAGWGGNAWTGDPDGGPALEDRDLLEWALDRLSADDREVLVLRELEGLSGREVAELLGISEAAMKSRLHRARLRFMAELRSQLEPSTGGGDE
jgi:RNA polymerase sigma-70 factor (ECF subfamily)